MGRKDLIKNLFNKGFKYKCLMRKGGYFWMTTVYDIPANIFIEELAKKLKEDTRVAPPDWAKYVRTGVHKETAPIDEDWWYIRCAAMARKIYINEPIGVKKLRVMYGGAKNRGSKPHRFKKGSGSITRKGVQQLETLNIVGRSDRGRIITAEGRSLMDNLAFDIIKELEKTIPELKKY